MWSLRREHLRKGPWWPALLLFPLVLAACAANPLRTADPNEAVIAIVEGIKPAVVDIEVVAGGPGAVVLGKERRGTGVIVDPGGHILTASHVVLGAEDLRITFSDGRQARADLAGTDADSGLAILRIPAFPGMAVAPLGRPADLRLGQLGIAISSQGGDERAVSTGVMSAFPPFEGYWEYRLERVIQTDAAINPGSSGGPLLDARGEVVGILSFSRSEGQRVNFAIPVDLLRGALGELIAHGKVASRPSRRWLGTYTVSVEAGVGVVGVTPGGPADRAGDPAGPPLADLPLGARPRDVILQVDGKPVARRGEFYEELWRGRAGDPVELVIRRGEENLTLTIPSGDRHDFFRTSKSSPQ